MDNFRVNKYYQNTRYLLCPADGALTLCSSLLYDTEHPLLKDSAMKPFYQYESLAVLYKLRFSSYTA